MKSFLGLTRRNLLLFFKDKQSVVFSLLASIIVFVLYLLFLKGTFVNAMNATLEEYSGLSLLISETEVNMFADLVLLTGILGTAMITVPYNCLTTIVRDKENKIDYDILATPIKRSRIILAYFVSAALSSIILTGIILSVGLVVISMQGTIYMDFGRIAAAYGTAALGSVSATAFFMIVVLFFKTTSASGAFFGILSAAAGFIIGAYVPISQFSTGVQTVCNIFPASHVTILMRNVMMNGMMEHMDSVLSGVDNGMFVSEIKKQFSFEAYLFGGYFDVSRMLIYVLAAAVICIALQIFLYSKTYKKK